MRVLIVPMAITFETAGPFSRVQLLADSLMDRGMSVAVCYAKDGNGRHVDGAEAYDLSVPVPLGLPQWLGSRVYPVADRLGIVGKKTIHSFEEVLHLTGASSYPYLKASVEDIRAAIRDFDPDVVYSECNISAIIAAKVERKPVLASYSYPMQPSYAQSPKYSRGVNRLLKELLLPSLHSTLELFSWANFRVIPSSPEIEPIEGEGNLFVGPFKGASSSRSSGIRDCVVIYLGNGAVPVQRVREVALGVFRSSPYEVYVAGMREEENIGNIHFASRFDFSSLLSHALVFVNHGGQNSVMDGFLYGVPQLVCPARLFERKFNAESVQKNGAGIEIGISEFRDDVVYPAVRRLISQPEYRENSVRLGASVASLGGSAAVARFVAENFREAS